MFTSLRARLALSSVGLSLAILLLLFSVSYISLGEFLEANTVATTRHNLQITMDILDRETASLRQLMSWFSVNGEVQDFVAAPVVQPDEVERRKKLAAFEILRSALYGNPLYGHINKLIIVDRHGRSIQLGSLPGHWSDAQVARDDVARSGGNLGNEHVVDDPFVYGEKRPAITLNKVIYQEYTGEEIAWIHVTLNTSLLTKYLSGYTFENDSQTYFVLGDTVLALDADRRFVPSKLPATAFHAERFSLKIGKPRLFVGYQGKGSGWMLAQSVPTAQFDRQNSIFLTLFAFVFLAMALLVSLLLTLVDRMINRPIDRIQRRLEVIAGGDFDRDPAIEFRHELGNIGRGINAMSRNIDELIATRIRDEATKKNLEFKMLQNQINPHFLYNTLNSIKWMAEIQKSRGIAEMVGSLAVLLKHVAKGTDELIPLAQELDLVREFCTIQDYRTGGLVTVKILVEEPSLEACPVLKFTLQPLVENALHHGIEPTGRPGTILIHCHVHDNNLLLDVTDDGAGIAPERLSGLLDQEAGTDGRGFSPIGLKNVDERIKLRFGPAYGLSVRSDPGVFTTVSVLVPWEKPCTPS